MPENSFETKQQLAVDSASHEIFGLAQLTQKFPAVARLPFSLKVLLENLLRHEDGRIVKREHIERMLAWNPHAAPDTEISFHPARVLLQDFTGVPAVVDMAAMREAIDKMGGDAKRINPLHPADLVIDHSVVVDHFGSAQSLEYNAQVEFERNHERYSFLRWGQQAFRNFRVVPPDTGICHQVNLEYLAQVVFQENAQENAQEGSRLFPDTLVGTDSHTTMVNALGVVGWGVGGIEAEAALLGQPITMLIPQVVGFKLKGQLPAGTTATDLVLTVTQMLRKKGVVGKFVEFFGPGISSLLLTDRATIANMAPEYGATIGFFPVDSETLSYLRFTGRTPEQVKRVEAYCRAQGMFYTPDAPEPMFSDTLELDLKDVEPCIAGPKRPQDRVLLKEAHTSYRKALVEMLATEAPKDDDAPPVAKGTVRTVTPEEIDKSVLVESGSTSFKLGHGAVVVAAITSCTNTSNPAVLMAAGLLAKKAVERGLATQPWVKTSLAPGSKVVLDYLKEANLMPYLEALGFHVVGYGCTTCIGNSGPLPDSVSNAVAQGDLVVASVLSGNRNFEGRINPQVRMNFLASPPLVVAYALAGKMEMDFAAQPIAKDRNGEPVFLKDLWPADAEIKAAIAAAVKPEQFRHQYQHALEGDARWQGLQAPQGQTFTWDPKSTYVRKPPFFDHIPKEPGPLTNIQNARVLALLGDSVTTDHISPAGNIAKNTPAARYLQEQGVEVKDFNSYGARRGNHEVMVRGTFGNIRLRNLLVPGIEGSFTVHHPTREKMFIYEASMKYQADHTPLMIIAGAEYGTGSSRDWAAKGTQLLGVKAVLAKSFERIHRSNLVGMGVLPLQFEPGEDATTLGLTGTESFDVAGVAEGLAPGKKLQIAIKPESGAPRQITVTARIDTPNELDYYRHGGILTFVLRQLSKA